MRLAFFGDVIGKPGRDALSTHLPSLRRRLSLDFVVINAENAAAGFGITERTAQDLFEAGACADYDSVIGMNKHISVARFASRLPGERQTPATGPATVCGVMVETDDRTGLALRIEPIRVGGRLRPALPDV